MPLTTQTLLKRMKEAGKLVRTDEGRGRNTVRVTADGHPRTVIVLCLSDILDPGGSGVEDDGADETDDAGDLGGGFEE